MTNILIIEDMPELSAEYENCLLSDGYGVDTANTQTLAEKKLLNNTYDLVLLDIALQDERNAGISIVSCLNNNNLDIPVIVISGLDPIIYRDIMRRLGVWDYLVKDTFDCSVLKGLVSRLLEAHEKMVGLQTITKDEFLISKKPPYKTSWKGIPLNLTNTQLGMVMLMRDKMNQVTTFKQFYEVIQSGHTPETVRTHIKNIKREFKSVDSDFNHITTIPGAGYMWRD